MNRYALIFPLIITNKSNIEYYAMAYYAMQTLHDVSVNNRNFDIIIYYYANYDIQNYNHFDGNQNLFKDFLDIKFIEFPFKIDQKNDAYFFKWKTIDHLFNNFDYDKVFILDVDLIFFDNPGFMFDKYDGDYAYILHEGSCDAVKKVLGKNGIAGGQLILNKNMFNKKIHNIYEKILHERSVLLNTAKIKLSGKDYEYFDKLVDQYSLMNCLLHSNIELKSLDTKDILYGKLACNINIHNNHNIEIKSNTKILHYLGNYAYLFLPDYLKNQKMKDKYQEKIKENPLIYY